MNALAESKYLSLYCTLFSLLEWGSEQVAKTKKPVRRKQPTPPADGTRSLLAWPHRLAADGCTANRVTPPGRCGSEPAEARSRLYRARPI